MDISMLKEHSGKWCLRRVLGSIGFLACVIAVFFNVNHSLFEPLIYSSCALITSTTVDMWKNKTNHETN